MNVCVYIIVYPIQMHEFWYKTSRSKVCEDITATKGEQWLSLENYSIREGSTPSSLSQKIIFIEPGNKVRENIIPIMGCIA